MKTSYKQSIDYQRRRQSRYEKEETPPLGKRLIEQVVTQFIICIFIVVTLFGTKLLGFTQFNKGIEKVKIAITYSPSLDEITREAKEVTSSFIKGVNKTDDSIEDEHMPVILIDDEIF